MNELSFIVQGPIYHGSQVNTKNTLESIRKYFPESPIILSTWENENLTGLNYDKVIFNKDPGFFVGWNGVPFNLNRQIISTYNGLCFSSSKYSAKIRTDTFFFNNNLLSILSKLKKAEVFQNYIVTPELFSRDPTKIVGNFLFHPSDIFLAGKTKDLKNLFDIPLANEKLILNDKKYPIILPEQYIFLMFLLKKFHRDYFKKLKITFRNVFISEKIIHSNFLILKDSTIGISLPYHILNGYEPKRTHMEINSVFIFNINSKVFVNLYILLRLILFMPIIKLKMLKIKIKRK